MAAAISNSGGELSAAAADGPGAGVDAAGSVVGAASFCSDSSLLCCCSYWPRSRNDKWSTGLVEGGPDGFMKGYNGFGGGAELAGGGGGGLVGGGGAGSAAGYRLPGNIDANSAALATSCVDIVNAAFIAFSGGTSSNPSRKVRSFTSIDRLLSLPHESASLPHESASLPHDLRWL